MRIDYLSSPLSHLLRSRTSRHFIRSATRTATWNRIPRDTSTMTTVNKTAHPFDKTRFDALLNRRFFYAPAFEIYGGVAGLYDYGPPGSSLQANIIAEWRRHFIVEEAMLELDTTIMTPSPVFEASGHVARFADWMVKDTLNGEVLRADHLVKNVLEARLAGDKEARGAVPVPVATDKKKKKQVKTTAVKLEDAVIAEYESILAQVRLGQLLRSRAWPAHAHALDHEPRLGHPVGEPQQFNLMFASSIGPTGQHPGYLRPETAQGHFLNFSRLLEFNNGRVPFASAQIGRSFRNEISPRAGLLRVREFTMAEIEHFVDPLEKTHTRFSEVAHVELVLLDKYTQASGQTTTRRMTVGEAVKQGVIANETLGYFVARIFAFLHMANEMAHYAADCWDAEIQNSVGGWTECVGCADRSAYDLSVHSAKTGQPLVVRQALKEPIVEEKAVAEWDKKSLGKTFKGDAAAVSAAVENMDEAALMRLKGELAQGPAKVQAADGREFMVEPSMLTIERKTLKTSSKSPEFTPNVIEPSFGLGRILYCLLEHSFWSREQDVERGVLSLPAVVAPTKVLIVPLSARAEFDPLVQEVFDDSNTSIGKRYARNDELGTPFGITLDFASVQNRTMTLRERDTTDQRIGSFDDVISTVTDLVFGTIDWSEACQRLPAYDGVQAVE
ncbi:unnamed protein product [Mycena citricolor]|uniref:glycine--tRNA ligase n=1 Tax=Mycena citricolor TaxID=2018698 RepID=A0AAD2HKK6_9AGAR|nr:unnamed protein product [Mycena citricolor]